MEISYLDLQKRYSEISNDELLSIYVSSDLTPEAYSLIEIEIKKRNLDSSDIQYAVKSEEFIANERRKDQDLIRRKTQIQFILFLILILLVITYEVLKYLIS